MRVAAIDVGTNSVHLMVAEIAADGSWTVVEKARQQIELGANGLGDNRIQPDAYQRGLDAMIAFKQVIDGLNVTSVNCAATSAVREAENGDDWCRAVREQAGIRVRTISGAEEGRLIHLGARADLDFSRGRVLLMDLGGGSTEFILCDSEGTQVVESIPAGHIRLADAFHKTEPIQKDDYASLKSNIKAVLKPLYRRVGKRDFYTLVGTSGTLRCLAMMATLARGDEAPEHSHGLVLHLSELEILVKQLKSSTFEEILAIPGMDPRRKRTITAGAVFVRQVMRAYELDELVTSERSLRDGLIVDWMLRHRPEIDLMASVPDPRERSVQRLLDRYGAPDHHAEHVHEFAWVLFDGLAPIHRLGFVERELLGHAARIHDIGHHISGKQHNKHGQYLIRHTRMHGFTAPEIAILGNIVRYHRGSKPKAHHAEFTALSEANRKVVRVLAGILRVADALDRSHTRTIEAVGVELGNGVIRLHARAARAAHLERWAIQRRTDLLESALRQDIRVAIDQGPPEVPSSEPSNP